MNLNKIENNNFNIIEETEYLKLSQKQLSYITAIIIMLLFIVFLIGYNLGKYNNNKIDYIKKAKINNINNPDKKLVNNSKDDFNYTNNYENSVTKISKSQDKKFLAQLITYDTEIKAKKFAEKNKKYANILTIKKNILNKILYQNIIISDNEEELFNQIEQIKSLENLKDIKISYINNNDELNIIKKVI